MATLQAWRQVAQGVADSPAAQASLDLSLSALALAAGENLVAIFEGTVINNREKEGKATEEEYEKENDGSRKVPCRHCNVPPFY